ncbi:hypothetical protein D3C80_1880000 [compost metagenome]
MRGRRGADPGVFLHVVGAVEPGDEAGGLRLAGTRAAPQAENRELAVQVHEMGLEVRRVAPADQQADLVFLVDLE